MPGKRQVLLTFAICSALIASAPWAWSVYSSASVHSPSSQASPIASDINPAAPSETRTSSPTHVENAQASGTESDSLTEEERERKFSEFAYSLASAMQKALKSEAKAIMLFSRLESCLYDAPSSGAETPYEQLMCLGSAESLAEEYPDSLGERFQAVLEQHPQLSELFEPNED